MGAALEIRNLHVNIDDTPILKGVNLIVQEGEVHALMGPNGSGKSTLSNTIMGHPAYKVTAGQIIFEGVDIVEMEADERARARAVPRVPVPSSHPRRDSRQFPAQRDQRPYESRRSRQQRDSDPRFP